MCRAYAPPSPRTDSSPPLRRSPREGPRVDRVGRAPRSQPRSVRRPFSLRRGSSRRVTSSHFRSIHGGSVTLRGAAPPSPRRHSHARSELGFAQSTTVCHGTSISSLSPRLSPPSALLFLARGGQEAGYHHHRRGEPSTPTPPNADADNPPPPTTRETT